MSDIGVSTTFETLTHKQRDGLSENGMECYWIFPTMPTVSKGDRLWMAVKGEWKGYFVLKCAFKPGRIVHFASETWVDHPGGKRSPFQGFTYKVPEVK